MDQLRSVLSRRLDESIPIEDRLDWVEPRTPPKPLPGLGKAVITPVLHVVHPEEYGVWNQIAEDAMSRLGLRPQFGYGWGFGARHEAVNGRIRQTAAVLEVDLWTVDTLWWLCELEHAPEKHRFEGGVKGHQDGVCATPPGHLACLTGIRNPIKFVGNPTIAQQLERRKRCTTRQPKGT